MFGQSVRIVRVMFGILLQRGLGMLFAAVLASSIVVSAALAQSAGSEKSSTGTPPPTSTSGISTRRHASHPPADLPPSARMFYQIMWGVDSLGVKSVESGKSYWMVFSNKGSFVKRGNRVSVEIGRFRVDGLVVQ